MQTFEYAGVLFTEPRSHPWQGSVGSAACRYYDLTTTPAHIRTSLEDFVPFRRYAAIGRFYGLLEAVNQPGSLLESNDCAFSGPHPNETPSMHKALECSGRVMLLFRALERNVRSGEVEKLCHGLHVALASLGEDFRWGVIGTSLVPVRYLVLPDRPDAQLGPQLMVSFWAFGDTEADTMRNLDRLFTYLSQALYALGATP